MRLAFSSQAETVKTWLSRIRKCNQLNVDWATNPRTPKELDVYTSGHRLFARGFVLYSFGEHFPMARWIPQQRAFTLNVDTYSNSTSKQQSLVRKWVNLYASRGFKSADGVVRRAPVFRLSYKGLDELKHVWLPEFDCVEILEYYHRRIRSCADLAKRARLHTTHYVDKATDWIAERNQFVQTFREPLTNHGIKECPELPEDVQSTLVLLKLTQP